MGFASGAIAFQRFFIDGRAPSVVDDAFVEQLNAKMFGKVAAQADGSHFGWVGPRHVFDTPLAGEHVGVGPYAHFALRVDKAKAPPTLVKSYLRIEEDLIREDSGKPFLTRGERRMAKEKALLRVEQEVRSGRHTSITTYPVLLDLDRGAAFLGATSTAAADRCMALFADTFGATLQPATAQTVAERLMASAGATRALEQLDPFTLIDAPADWTGGPSFDHDLNFLGKELLTWLWRRTDQDDGPLRVRTGNELSVMIDRALRLKCDFGLTGVDMITADNPAGLPEARAALQIGKQPVKAGLTIGAPLGEYRCTLDAPRLTVTGFTPPEPDGEVDAAGLLEHRFEAVTTLADLIDALLDVFLEARVGRAWSTELREMRAWAAGTEAVADQPLPRVSA